MKKTPHPTGRAECSNCGKRFILTEQNISFDPDYRFKTTGNGYLKTKCENCGNDVYLYCTKNNNPRMFCGVINRELLVLLYNKHQIPLGK
jgi:ribosomal protein S27AE